MKRDEKMKDGYNNLANSTSSNASKMALSTRETPEQKKDECCWESFGQIHQLREKKYSKLTTLDLKERSIYKKLI